MEQEKEVETSQKKPRRCVKFLLIFLILAIVGAVVYFYRDKPCKMIQTTDFDAEVDASAGEIVDYHYAYNALQDEDVEPVEENGWRLILQAFGPRALEGREPTSQVSWDEYPTTSTTHDLWVRLCQKFKLDPNERSLMFDREDLWRFVEKNGLTGNEPDPEETEVDYYDDENIERAGGETTKVDSLQVFDALMSKPWTREEYPIAAQWFEENVDYMDVFSRAARSPRCVCWKVLDDLPDGNFIATPLPDVLYAREIARLLVARANYRLGSGDVSGAIDDVETITLLARAMTEAKAATTVERTVGLTNLAYAAGVELFNSPVPPTEAELARIKALWRDFCESDYFAHGLENALESEKIFVLGTFQDLLVLRRRGSIPFLLGLESPGNIDGTFQWLARKAIEWTFISAPPLNDAKTFGKFRAMWERMKTDSASVEKELSEDQSVASWLTSTPETNFSSYGARILLVSFQVVRDVFRRCDCVAREKLIVGALWAYQAEHGTLPPAFTTDAEGKPLHSWRVLILPYLGEEEKALYNEIALDEPWDSERNREFFPRVPKAYRCPALEANQAGTEASRGDAGFSVLIGDDGFFDESGVGKDFNAIREAKGYDATRQPVVVDRGEPVCWMKPDAELRIDDYATGSSEGVERFFKEHRHSDGLNYATLGGSVSFLSEMIEPSDFNALLRGLPEPPKKDGFLDWSGDATLEEGEEIGAKDVEAEEEGSPVPAE